MIRIISMAVVLLWTALSGSLHAQTDVAGAVAEAAVMYRQGQFAAAAARLEAVVKEGHKNGHVYYNLGNAYFKAGDIGAAMAAYLAARHYLPRDPDVAANLRFVHQQIVDQVGYQGQPSLAKRLLFWTAETTEREQLFAGALLLGVALLLLAAPLWLGKWFWLNRIGYSLLLCGFLATVGWLVTLTTAEHWAAVQSPSAEVYSAPSTQGNTVLFRLNQGAPMRIRATSSDGRWLKIAISDGKTGWIPVEQSKSYQ